MAARIRFSDDPLDDPVLDIFAACEEVDALITACETLFAQLKPIVVIDCAETEALPILLRMISSRKFDIHQSATRLEAFFAGSGNSASPTAAEVKHGCNS